MGKAIGLVVLVVIVFAISPTFGAVVLTLAIGGGVVGFIVKALSGGGSSDQGRETTPRSYIPPPPLGEAMPPWSNARRQVEVAGESYYVDSLTAVFADHGGMPAMGQDRELHLDAQLVAAPTNPYDPNAVAVYVDGRHVGYLEQDTAPEYHRPVAQLAERGKVLTVPARQWIRAREGRAAARVTVKLPPPAGLEPVNPLPPDPCVVLPAGSTVQVTKEDEHMAVLRRYVEDDVATPIAVTLVATTEVRPRSTVDVVEVRLDGEQVGVLSPTQTANLKPLVDFVAGQGARTVARASVSGNQLKADVVLYVAKAQDVGQRWLEATAKHVKAKTVGDGASQSRGAVASVEAGEESQDPESDEPA